MPAAAHQFQHPDVTTFEYQASQLAHRDCPATETKQVDAVSWLIDLHYPCLELPDVAPQTETESASQQL